MLKDKKKLWIIIPILILLNNIFAIYRSIYNKSFNLDDFQHVHIAWNQFNGLLVYRDFFEHHGPIYTLFNSFLLSTIKDPASFETLIIFRHYSFFSILLIVFLIFLIAKVFLKSNSLAFLSSTIFTMWHIVQAISVDIRPDFLQTVFALIGFYIFIIKFESGKALSFIFSGIFFGLMICCNFKSIILIVAIFLFLAYRYFIEKQARSLIVGLFTALGTLSICALFCLYFYSQGILNDFLYYNTVFNFYLSSNSAYASIGKQLTLQHFLKDFLLCLFAILGIFSMKFDSSSTKLLLICSLLPIYGCFIGLFHYYCITFLPFLSIYAAQGFNQYLIQKQMNYKWLAILFFVGLALLTNNIKRSGSGRNYLYLSQKNTLNFALKNFDREEKIAAFHRACPAYIFNKDINYFWLGDPGMNKLLEGSPFRVENIGKINPTEVPVIAFIPKVYDKVTYERQSHFKKNYKLIGPKPFQCIWLGGNVVINE